MKTIVQCDFDGTITEEDIGFMLLDRFAEAGWRKLLASYREGKMSVGEFNKKVFAMVRTDKETLVGYAVTRGKVRAGLDKLVSCCQRRGFDFAIVSNGLDFYIEAILKNMGINSIQVFAAQTQFTLDGIQASYIGPDGTELMAAFKEAYVKLFSDKGYRVVYVGNGLSDISPARLAQEVFARDDLLEYCKRENLLCVPFSDLYDVARGLKSLAQPGQ
jgi:2-hydroxy-3-keto-5-methylthiopentenyl-1-phosphate phosphatase